MFWCSVLLAHGSRLASGTVQWCLVSVRCRVVIAQAVGRTLMGESSAAERRRTDGVRLWVCRMVGRHTYVVCWGPSLRSGLVYRVWCVVGSGGVT